MPSASVPPPSTEVLTLQVEQDPDAWLRVAAWLVVIFSVAQVLVFSFGRDQGIYGVVGEGILRGQVPYRDLWDFKPPGIFFVYAASFFVFGKTMMAPRLVEALLLIGAVLGLRRLGGVLFQSRTAGILGGAVYALVYAQMDFWHSGQPESFAGPLTVYALVLTTHPWPTRHAPYAMMATGFVFGMAFLLKPPLGGGAIACAYFLASYRRASGHSWRSASAPFLWIGVASAAPIALCCLWFYARGGWPALSWTLLEFAPGYTALSWTHKSAGALFFDSLSEGFFGLSSLLAFGTICAATLHPRAEREREGFWLVLSVLSFQFIGIAVQGKFFQYHFGASLGLIALLCGQGYYKLWRRVGLESLSGSFAFSGFLLVATTMRLPVNDTPGGSFWARSVTRMQYLVSAGSSLSRSELDEQLHYVGSYNLDGTRLMALEVRRHVRPGARVYLWGFEPVFYSLSETTPASRYIYNVAQRAKWQSKRARATLMNDLRAHPPEAVVTQRLDVMPNVTGNPLDSKDSLPDFPELNGWLHHRYQEAKTIDRFTLWLPLPPSLRGLAPKPNSP